MVTLPDEKKVKELIKQNFSVDSKRAWILLSYRDPQTIVLEANGTGPLSEVTNLLKEDQVQYFLIRVPLGDTREHVSAGAEINVSKVRDYCVAWTGPKVGMIEKGKKKADLGAVQALLSPSHAQLYATNRANITEESLKIKSDPKSGSHTID